MARGARYTVKQRQFVERKRIRTPWFSGSVNRWGKWVVLGRFLTKEEAQALRDQRARVGLQQTVVTFKGKVVIDHAGYDYEHTAEAR